MSCFVTQDAMNWWMNALNWARKIKNWGKKKKHSKKDYISNLRRKSNSDGSCRNKIFNGRDTKQSNPNLKRTRTIIHSRWGEFQVKVKMFIKNNPKKEGNRQNLAVLWDRQNFHFMSWTIISLFSNKIQ